jgi:CDP-glucose 4,6-dehydratase
MVTSSSTPHADFWYGRRVLLTGHTGFKGAWLALWLQRLGARVTGLSLAPSTTPNLFSLADVAAACDHRVVDVRDEDAVRAVVDTARPEVVLHLAAQALVRRSYREPLDTFATNVMGTAHVLEALRGNADVRVVVVVTTDKVYRNHEWPWPYREGDALGGHDPYSASKAACEHVVDSYRAAFLAAQGVRVATARAGNVIGGGDWSEDRLIPDAVRAWSSGTALDVRRPQGIRPWQHVLEPLSAYLTLAERLWTNADGAGAWNFGPETHEAATVRTVVEVAQKAWGGGDVRWGDGTAGPHEAGWLALEVAKARTVLGVRPRWALHEAVTRTLRWYRAQHDGADARALCLADLDAFVSADRSAQ